MKNLKIETAADLIDEIYKVRLKSNPVSIKNLVDFINSEDCTKKIINSRTFDGNTPLHSAVYLVQFEIVEALIKKGADINLVLKKMSPLMSAIINISEEESNAKIINLLIDSGANLEPIYNQSAFNLACLAQKNNAIQKMLPLNPNLYFKDELGKTAIEHLEYTGNEEGLKMVQSYLLQKSLQEELPNQKNEININKTKL